MSDVIAEAVAAMQEKMGGRSFDGKAKFVFSDAGAFVVEGSEVRAGDEDADVTLTADTETFKALLDGEMNPTVAFMSGKLSVDGDMSLAMQLGTLLS